MIDPKTAATAIENLEAALREFRRFSLHHVPVAARGAPADSLGRIERRWARRVDQADQLLRDLPHRGEDEAWLRSLLRAADGNGVLFADPMVAGVAAIFWT